MDTVIRTDEDTIKKLTTSEQVFSIAELEQRLADFKSALEYDARAVAEMKRVEEEIQKTALDENQKQQILQSFNFSGSGVSQEMVDALQKEIEKCKALPIEKK